MREQAIIQETPEPRTRRSLAADLRALGVKPGMTLLVHSSLSSIGWVCGRPVAVVQALFDALEPSGTLIMPTHTSANSEPSDWQNPLAEYRTPGTSQLIEGASVLEDGLPCWKTFSDLDWNADPFAEIGTAFETASPVNVGLVGSATSRLFRQRPAVDYAGDWLSRARSIKRP